MPTSNDPRQERSPDEDPVPTSPVEPPDAADDLAEFATFRRSAGNLPVVAALVVALVFSLAVLGWVFLR